MNIATIKVSGVKAVTNDYPTIPAGIVGATVTFEFADPAWDGLSKTAVFRGCVTRDVLMTGNVVRIPAETVAQECPFLFVGVYGTDAADNVVIPTLWLSLCAVRSAADPSGDPGTDPELPIWAQLQDRVEALESGAPSDPDSPVTPGRPGEPGEDGGYYTPAVTQPSSDTVEFAFSPSKPDMPAVDPVQVKLPVGQSSGGNVELDTTLTQSGKAADAKAVGDLLGSLTLGQHTDGLIYIFIGGKPVGKGLSITSGEVVEPVYGGIVTDTTVIKLGAGQSGMLGLKLDTEPTQDQTIRIFADSDLVTLDKSEMVFNATNWNEYQFLTITASALESDATVTITMENSDELLTDKSITVYLIADAYSVDTTIPTENQHILVASDFDTVTVTQAKYGINLKGYIGEYENIVVPQSMEYNGVTYTPVIFGDAVFSGKTNLRYVTCEGEMPRGTGVAVTSPNYKSFFAGCSNLVGVKFSDAAIDAINRTAPSMASCFLNCSNLQFVDGLERITAVNSMQSMFENCVALEYVQDLSGIVPSEGTATDGTKTFYGCTSLKKIYGTPQFKNIASLFYNCNSLEYAVIPPTAGIYKGALNSSYLTMSLDGCRNLKTLIVLCEQDAPALPALDNECVVYAIKGSAAYTELQSAISSHPTVTLIPYGEDSSAELIVVWGDSTSSPNKQWGEWPERLQEKLGMDYTISNQAFSGEFTTSTSARQGGNALSVSAFTIPAAIEPVSITLKSKDGQTFGTSPVFSAGGSFNPCEVVGVKGTISQQSGKYTFTRYSAGAEVSVPDNSIVTSVSDANLNKDGNIMLVNLGINWGWSNQGGELDASVLLTQVKSMVEHFNGSKYIICGPSMGTKLEDEEHRAEVLEYEELAAAEFGEHWLNLREYLIENGLRENGLVATASDTERIAVGIVPGSLLGAGTIDNILMYPDTSNDFTHPNAYGANSIMLAFYNKGVELGYWT